MLLVVYQRVCDFHVLLPGGSVHLAKKPGKRDMGGISTSQETQFQVLDVHCLQNQVGISPGKLT